MDKPFIHSRGIAMARSTFPSGGTTDLLKKGILAHHGFNANGIPQAGAFLLREMGNIASILLDHSCGNLNRHVSILSARGLSFEVVGGLPAMRTHLPMRWVGGGSIPAVSPGRLGLSDCQNHILAKGGFVELF